MTPERWQQVNQLFMAAAELEPEQRAVFLDQACSDDPILRSEVESLLESDVDSWELIEKQALEVAAPLLAHERQQLTPGQSFSHYEIVSLIGKGGMGEVYLAADKLLNRKIALKLLPADYTRDKERLRRFQQEAQAASALNHPNILTIHEFGQTEDQRFIATEFVDGETLRQHMAHKPMTVSETLEIAVQIASALAAAHQAGIVHRDIKPENIMLRRDGYMKVLDFGLAKLTEQQDPSAGAKTVEDVNISSGLVMGTVKYMSPEQARGRRVDPRSDIFSFGVVLYEMLAGRAPFEGEGHELLGAILKKDPPPLANAPDEIQRLISRTLQKKKEDRYQTIQELLIDLKRLQEDKTGPGGVVTASQAIGESPFSTSEAPAVSTVSTVQVIVSSIKRHKTGAALVLAGLAVVGFGLTGELNRFRSRLHASPKEIKITRIANTDKVVHAAVSPNGKYIAYSETGGPASPYAESLWVLEVATNNRFEIKPPGAFKYDGLTYSTDGGEIFYVSDGVLYKLPAGGGETTKVLSDVGGTISFAPDGKQFVFVRGLNEEETLIVANVDGSGERAVATRKRPEFINPDGPAWSPDGRLIACWVGVMAKGGTRSVIGFDATTGEERKITDQKWDEIGSRPIWLPDGSGLLASAGGAETWTWEIAYPSGEAHRITSGYFEISLTSDGENLLGLGSVSRTILWLMPNGDPNAARPLTYNEEFDTYVSLTPDGKILNTSNMSGNRDVWIINSDGTNPKQLTMDAGVNLQPAASRDGRYIVFSSNRANRGAFNIWRMDSDGGNPVQLTNGSGEGQPVCSPDGRWVVYSQGGPNVGPWDKTLWKVSIDGGEPVQLSDKPSAGPAISPDGTLIACWYTQDSATQDPPPPLKIALIPFAGGPPVKILDAIRTANVRVRWSPDGQAIAYVNLRPGVSNIWSQPISGAPAQQVTQFTSEQIGGFDWSDDGTLVCSRTHYVSGVALITDFR